MTDIMLDLETMGTGNNAAIVAVGACAFDIHGDSVLTGPAHNFYQKVSLESSVAAGMQIDTSTILWWMQQSDDARSLTFEGETSSLAVVCRLFHSWLAAFFFPPVWGSGATFDNVIIRSAFKAVGATVPWSFRDDKCYRTVCNLLPKSRQPEFVRSGTAHNALDDARTQALHLQKVYKALGL